MAYDGVKEGGTPIFRILKGWGLAALQERGVKRGGRGGGRGNAGDTVTRAAHYTGSNMNLLPEIPPPSPLHTPRAQPLWPLAGANGGETCMSSRPRGPPPRAVALRRGPRCPCTLASRCKSLRAAKMGGRGVARRKGARVSKFQGRGSGGAGGREPGARGQTGRCLLLPRLDLGIRAVEQLSSRAVEQPQQQLFACSTPTHQPRSLGLWPHQ